MCSTHSMKYIWYSLQKSKYPLPIYLYYLREILTKRLLTTSFILIRTHLAYIANAKNSCYIKQQFTVLKARAS